MLVYRQFYSEEKESLRGVIGIHVQAPPQEKQPLAILGNMLQVIVFVLTTLIWFGFLSHVLPQQSRIFLLYNNYKCSIVIIDCHLSNVYDRFMLFLCLLIIKKNSQTVTKIFPRICACTQPAWDWSGNKSDAFACSLIGNWIRVIVLNHLVCNIIEFLEA